MDATPRQYVKDLKNWNLPRVEDLEDSLIDELVAKAPVSYFDRSCLGDELHRQFVARLRELARTTVNETIEYWLKGLADGSNGEFPEWCLEFPFWQRGEDVEPLTLAYCVDNDDGTRTEINRIDFGRALMRLIENREPCANVRERAETMVAHLRELADKFESVCRST